MVVVYFIVFIDLEADSVKVPCRIVIMEASGDASWLENESQSGEEQYGSDGDDEERLVVNPVSVRSRIDVCFAIQ
jgi:hypothetical protein